MQGRSLDSERICYSRQSCVLNSRRISSSEYHIFQTINLSSDLGGRVESRAHTMRRRVLVADFISSARSTNVLPGVSVAALDDVAMDLGDIGTPELAFAAVAGSDLERLVHAVR
jgi:hypothetical protein